MAMGSIYGWVLEQKWFKGKNPDQRARSGADLNHNEIWIYGFKQRGRIDIYSDSLLVVSQVSGDYQANEERMASYLGKVRVELQSFREFTVRKIPREQNLIADALARLALAIGKENVTSIPVKFLHKSSIALTEPEVQAVNQKYC